jgi:L-threonylcarbamoyladenylate synthase
MFTRIIDTEKDYKEAVRSSVELLRSGNVICFPTDTVYGLGCDFFNEKAIVEIFGLKNRDYSKPFAGYISRTDDITKLCKNIPEVFYKIARRFLPGPLTFILEKADNIKSIYTTKDNTISIRIPGNDLLLEIIDMLGSPIAGTSANLSGNKSQSAISGIIDEFDGKIPLILDNGITDFKTESTIISLLQGKIELIREGALKFEEIIKFVNQSEII